MKMVHLSLSLIKYLWPNLVDLTSYLIACMHDYPMWCIIWLFLMLRFVFIVNFAILIYILFNWSLNVCFYLSVPRSQIYLFIRCSVMRCSHNFTAGLTYLYRKFSRLISPQWHPRWVLKPHYVICQRYGMQYDTVKFYLALTKAIIMSVNSLNC